MEMVFYYNHNHKHAWLIAIKTIAQGKQFAISKRVKEIHYKYDSWTLDTGCKILSLTQSLFNIYMHLIVKQNDSIVDFLFVGIN